MCKAIDIAKWLIKNDYDEPRNSKNGNMKVNKLLYLAQLISLIKKDKPLFNDEMYAFENGVVIENVRQRYQRDYTELYIESKNSREELSEEDKYIVNITIDIFGNVSAEELSEITHQHKCWKDYLEFSKEGNYHNKMLSVIPIEKLNSCYDEDLKRVELILKAYEELKNKNESIEEKIKIGGRDFYYNPEEVNIDDETLDILLNFQGEESAYTIYLDEKQGLVIY